MPPEEESRFAVKFGAAWALCHTYERWGDRLGTMLKSFILIVGALPAHFPKAESQVAKPGALRKRGNPPTRPLHSPRCRKSTPDDIKPAFTVPPCHVVFKKN